MKKLLCFFLMLLSGQVLAQHTYYISSGIGADTNTSTQAQSKTTPWAHLPGMATCASACASYTPVAGDQFILRGGDTWTNSSFPVTWAWAGISGHVIYIGVDQTWFTGGSWVRPIFNAGGVAISGSKNVFFSFSNNSFLTFDNIEFTGQFWSGAGTFGSLGVFTYFGADFITYENLFIHNWTHASSGASDGNLIMIIGQTTSPFCEHCLATGNTIENADGSGDSGYAFYSFGGTITNNIIHDLPNAILTAATGNQIAGNLIYNITFSFTGTHNNAIESVITNTANLYIHDNVIHDVSSGGEEIMVGNTGETDYVWNNVIYNSPGANTPSLTQNSGQSPGSQFFYNNTIVSGGSVACFQQPFTPSNTPIIQLINNHCITTGSLDSLTTGTITRTTNLLQTPTVATGQGYTASQTPYVYFPTSGGGTIGAGTNETSSWPGGFSTNDTTYGDVRTTNARPTSAAWDIGAFQFTSGTLATPQFEPGVDLTSGTSFSFNLPFTLDIPTPLQVSGVTYCVGLNVTPTATTAGTCDSITGEFTYTGSFTVSGNATYSMIATEAGFTNSAAYTLTYGIPSLFPIPNIYSFPMTGTGSCAANGNCVQLSVPQGSIPIYTTDGSTPTNNASLCTALNGTATTNGATIAFSTTTTVKVLPCSGAGVTGSVITGVYTIRSPLNWYIRTGGGTRFSAGVPTGQCNGNFDADYPGTGTNQNCAFNDFRYLWSDNHTSGAGAWIVAGGETVIIRGCTALGSQVNPANPDCRLGWDTGLNGNSPNSWCPTIGNNACRNPNIPAGSSSQHTQFLGQNYASCNTGGATNPKTYESQLNQLFGGFGLASALNMRATQWVDFECMEITGHNKTGARTAWSSATTYPLGPGISAQVSYLGNNYVSLQAGNLNNVPASSPTFWGLANNCNTTATPNDPVPCISGSFPVDDYVGNLIQTDSTTSNILMQDFYVHGSNSSGFFGPLGGPITLNRIFVGFNAFAAWNFDNGAPTLPNSPTASITAHFVEMDGNGCYEEYPIVDAFPGRKCYDSSSGGFGDTWSGQNSTLQSFTIDHMIEQYNTKDSFIGPHTWTNTISITDSFIQGTMGETWKWGGFYNPNNTTFTNNLTVGNCNRMSQPITGFPTGYNKYLTAFCRAGGSVVASVIPAGSTWTLGNNTWAGYDPIFLEIAAPNASVAPGTPTLNLFNNIFIGWTNSAFPTVGNILPALYAVAANVTRVSTNNVEYQLKSGTFDPCTGTIICTTPLLVGQPAIGAVPPESALDNFNFNLTGTSPAIGAGTTYTGLPASDYNGVTTTSPPVIGGLNFVGGFGVNAIANGIFGLSGKAVLQ